MQLRKYNPIRAILITQTSLVEHICVDITRLIHSYNLGDTKGLKRYFDDLLFDVRELSDYAEEKDDRSFIKNLYLYLKYVIHPFFKPSDPRQEIPAKAIMKLLNLIRHYFESNLNNKYRTFAEIQKMHNKLDSKYKINTLLARKYNVGLHLFNKDILSLVYELKKRKLEKVRSQVRIVLTIREIIKEQFNKISKLFKK